MHPQSSWDTSFCSISVHIESGFLLWGKINTNTHGSPENTVKTNHIVRTPSKIPNSGYLQSYEGNVSNISVVNGEIFFK